MKRSLAGRASALVVIGLALTACSGVPTSGPIQQGPVVAPVGEDQFIRVIARPPVDGMSPEAVVRGFQEATASADAGYTVARAYLTPAASTSWDPNAGVEIYDNAGLTTTSKSGAVVQDGVLSAVIDRFGEYSVAPPASRRTWSYSVEQVGGQWRIAQLPPGLVLSPGDIDRGYRSFDLYYWTRDFNSLVPAPVTIPLSESGLATQLVRGLLGGPTPWIAPAVLSAFPDGTRLANDSVPVVDGIADVAFTRELLSADDATRQRLSAQLVWTLKQLPEVTSVRISVNGQALAVPGASPVQPIDSWSVPNPDGLSATAVGYGLSKGALVRFAADSQLLPVTRPRPTIDLPAVSLDSARLAGLSADHRRLSVGKLTDTALTSVYSGTDLSRPSWDSAGNVWVADRGAGIIMVHDRQAVVMPVADLTHGFDVRSVTAVAMSRDGTRLAMLARRGSVVEPWVARVERAGGSVKLSSPQRVAPGVVDSLDLAWLDAGTLAVLGTESQTSLEVLELGVGSSRIRRTAAPDSRVTMLAAAPGRPLLVANDTSTWRFVSPSWSVQDGVTDPVYPG